MTFILSFLMGNWRIVAIILMVASGVLYVKHLNGKIEKLTGDKVTLDQKLDAAISLAESVKLANQQCSAALTQQESAINSIKLAEHLALDAANKAIAKAKINSVLRGEVANRVAAYKAVSGTSCDDQATYASCMRHARNE